MGAKLRSGLAYRPGSHRVESFQFGEHVHQAKLDNASVGYLMPSRSIR
jgi:hypothetical protein